MNDAKTLDEVIIDAAKSNPEEVVAVVRAISNLSGNNAAMEIINHLGHDDQLFQLVSAYMATVKARGDNV